MLVIITIFLDMTAPPIFSNICELFINQTLYWKIFLLMWLGYFSRYSIIPAKRHHYHSTMILLQWSWSGACRGRAQRTPLDDLPKCNLHPAVAYPISICCCYSWKNGLDFTQALFGNISGTVVLCPQRTQWQTLPAWDQSTSVLGQCRLTQDKVCCRRGVPGGRLFFIPASLHHFVQFSRVADLR